MTTQLTRAFQALRRKQIIALQNFSCCQSCALSELERDLEEGKRQGIGYVFFHQQEGERKAEGYDFHLYYGKTPGAHCEAKDIANTVVETLREFGVLTEWNGSESEAIKVINRWD